MKDKRIPLSKQKEIEQQFLQALGKKIRKLRFENDNMSQEALGLECNLDRTYIGGIERGERNPTVLNLKKIADALGVSVEQLFSEGSK
ncbi:helix-turn-helix domain-containing protein [Heyndrickxia camelliae]|uniref:XRE family transcriptional regulator n=1 Tax=Heyndrickxia camelliae TaxID=1707093 RepID=A0A2N3LH26_9BACI|nr:helix-turn-helix transcriptional regulator [Heyndrickxia camelliae]PKR83889.1 XRE family transcriptional regulator [Heyndrickxia camelliae]